jgi:hypothetical protein
LHNGEPDGQTTPISMMSGAAPNDQPDDVAVGRASAIRIAISRAA